MVHLRGGQHLEDQTDHMYKTEMKDNFWKPIIDKNTIPPPLTTKNKYIKKKNLYTGILTAW